MADLEPLSDPAKTIGDIDKSTQAVTEALSSQRNVLENSAVARSSATGAFKMLTDQITPVLDNTFKDLNDALDKKENISQYPKFVGEVLGLFDKDWNTNVQDVRLKRGGVTLQMLDQKMQLGKIVTDTAIAAANQSDLTAAATTETRLRDVQAGTTLLAAGEAATTLRGQELNQLVNSLDDKALALAVSGKDNRVPVGNAKAEAQRRSAVGLSLESAALANKNGNMDLQTKLTNDAFGKYTLPDFDAKINLLKDKTPDANGLYSLDTRWGPIKFSMQQLITARSTREKADTVLHAEDAQRREALGILKTGGSEIDAINQNITQLDGGMSPVRATQIRQLNARLNAASGIATDEDGKPIIDKTTGRPMRNAVASPEEAARIIKETQDQLTKQIDEITKNHDETIRPAVREFLSSGNFSPQNAAKFTLAQTWAGNPGIGTPYAEVYGDIGKRIRSAAQGKGLIGGLGDGTMDKDAIKDIMSGKNVTKLDELIASALNKENPVLDPQGRQELDSTGKKKTTTPHKQYSGTVFQTYVDNIMQGLAKPITNADGSSTTQSYYHDYMDSSGKLSEEYMKDPHLLIQKLETRSKLLQSEGKLAPDANLASVLVKRLQDETNRKNFTEMLQSKMDINGKALSKLLVNNREDRVMLPYISNLSQQQLLARGDNAKIDATQRAESIRRTSVNEANRRAVQTNPLESPGAVESPITQILGR